MPWTLCLIFSGRIVPHATHATCGAMPVRRKATKAGSKGQPQMELIKKLKFCLQ